jgi:hypothetical protein
MTQYGYPRLGDGDALIRLEGVKSLAAESPARLTDLVAFDHPGASPVATGAVIAGEEQLRNLRAAVEEAVGAWLTGMPVPPGSTAAFDITLGKALHAAGRFLPADAAHKETWNFVSAMVFPDVVWARFPELHEDRFLGKPRNALRRVWQREEVLGDLLDASVSNSLGEDELVGLLERTALARNRRLVRALARAVLDHKGGSARSAFARDLYKRVTYLTGPFLLDVVGDVELERLVALVAEGHPWLPEHASVELGATAPDVTVGGRHRADLSWSPAIAHSSEGEPGRRQKEPGDIVREFHQEMERLCARVMRETSYKPTRMLTMIQQMGGVEAARKIAGSANPSEGFIALWELGRLDLTVEQLVLRDEFVGLFPEHLVEVAEAKLRQAGVEPGRGSDTSETSQHVS